MRLLAMLVVCGLPAFVQAADVEWYVGGRTSLGRMLMEDARHGDSVGSGQVIGNIGDGAFVDTDARDYSNGIGIAAGLELDRWSLEAELLWRYRSDWDLAAPTPSRGVVSLFRTNYGTTTLFFNGMRRGALGARWHWEAGLGAGLVRKVFDSEFIERGEVRDLPDELVIEDSRTEVDVGWQLLAGLTRSIGERWRLHMRYRYADFGALKAGPYDQRNEHVSGDLQVHEVTLGFDRHL